MAVKIKTVTMLEGLDLILETDIVKQRINKKFSKIENVIPIAKPIEKSKEKVKGETTEDTLGKNGLQVWVDNN